MVLNSVLKGSFAQWRLCSPDKGVDSDCSIGRLIEKRIVHCSDLSVSPSFSFSWKLYRSWTPQFWNFGEVISTVCLLQTSIRSRSFLELSASGIQKAGR